MSINNCNKLENFLETAITKYNFATEESEKDLYGKMIDEIYASERKNAAFACRSKDKSMGFAYIVEDYRNHEQGLELFSSRMINEVLTVKTNAKKTIHENYSSYRAFSDDATGFLCGLIAEYDTDLAEYVKANSLHMQVIEDFTESVEKGWRSNAKVSEIMKALDEYYAKSFKETKMPKAELYVHIFKTAHMLPDLERFGFFDGMSDKERETLISSDGFYAKLKNIKDINKVTEMTNIIYLKAAKGVDSLLLQKD